MSNINQRNKEGDNIGKNKYVLNVGFSKIKIWYYVLIILLILAIIYSEFFSSLLLYLVVDNLLKTLILTPLFFFLGKRINEFCSFFCLLLMVPLFVYLDISSVGEAQHSINFVGYFSIDKNGHLKKDDGTASLSNLFSSSLKEKSNQHAAFKSNIIDFNIIEIPSFLVSIIGVNGLKKMISMRQDDYHSLDFYCVRKEDKITLNIIPNLDVYSIGIHIEQMAREISKLSTCLDTEDFNNLSSSMLIAAFGQSSVQPIYLEDSNFSLAYSLMTDSEKLIKEVEKIPEMCASNNSRFLEEINSIKAGLHREKFKIAISQKNYNKAVEYFSKAIEYSSTYPYSSYDRFKVEYTKNYYKNIGQMRREIFDTPPLTENIYTDAVADNMGFLIDDYKEFPQEYLPVLFGRLSKKEKLSDSVYLFLMSQVVKILPSVNSNEQMFLELYPSQIEKSIKYLDRLLIIDPDFELVKVLKEMYMSMSGRESIKEVSSEKRRAQYDEFFNIN